MKRKQIIIGISVFVLLILAGGVALYYYRHQNTTQKTTTIITQQNGQNSGANTTSLIPQTQTSVVMLYYPMTNFNNRITFRSFGQLVKPTDTVSPCGAPFSGYHDADDLEVTAAEVNTDVPVYAITDGMVLEVGPVSGYGGLLVLGVTIKRQSYTVYYGHINLGSTTLVAGNSVVAGQRLASLGAQCSAQTDGERKHLHFAIHIGTAIDVRGYVPTLSVLADWVNPKVFLAEDSASSIQ
jgi:murein DD-endopeptidase MepM/ murein hydrolase activator NlpD